MSVIRKDNFSPEKVQKANDPFGPMGGGLFEHLLNQFGGGQQLTTDSFNIQQQPQQQQIQQANNFNVMNQIAMLQQQQQQMLANMGNMKGGFPSNIGVLGGGNNMVANYGWGQQQPAFGQQFGQGGNNGNYGYGNGWR
jgi:hypothetical protein